MPTTPTITVNIRNLAVGGSGVGEVVAVEKGDPALLGITAFVPFTTPGERVTARVVERKERYLNADLLEVLEASAERVQPPCPYYMQCGGCELQHMSYEKQLHAKEQMILGALNAGRLPQSVLSTVKPLEASAPFGYRRRITLHIDSQGKVGFYRQQSRAVVSITSCLVSIPSINELLANIQSLGQKLAGKISSLQLEADPQGVIAVLKAPYALGADERRNILKAAEDYFSDVSLLAAGTEVGGFGRQILELPLNAAGSATLRIPAGYFSQVNWNINLQHIKRVVEAVGAPTGLGVYDLYAGGGNFALPLARAGAQVTAVECDARLASLGRENAARLNLGRKLNYHEESVERFLEKGKGGLRADVIVADPPRSGLGKLVSELQFSKRFVLIACHLPSFVRDVKAFCDLGWSVKSIEPFDMFPQTSYVETLGVLERD